jgi:hypothetical protein
MNEKDQQQVDVAGSPRRVLVCGSRSWAGWRSGGSWAPSPQQRHEAAVLISALERVFCEEDAPVPILVHGACRTGADALADYWAHRHGILIEVYPANWVGACRVSCRPGHRRVRPDGSDYCPSAGINRNADMIASLRPGRDVVIAAWDGRGRRGRVEREAAPRPRQRRPGGGRRGCFPLTVDVQRSSSRSTPGRGEVEGALFLAAIRTVSR